MAGSMGRKHITRVAFVGLFNDTKFLAQVGAFVKDVSRIKDNKIEKLAPKNMPEDIFSNEFQGSKSVIICLIK